jgi:DNA polymerase III subunit beta
MKIECTQENLIKGLNIVSHIAGKNVSLPILNNVLLKAEKGKFKMISTNLDIGIKTIVRGKIEVEGELTVQARLLTDYISLLQQGNVVLEKKETSLFIKAGQQETVIKGQDAEDFPIVPEPEGENGFKLKAKDFKDFLTQVIFSASYDDVRPEFTGVLFNNEEDVLYLVATDSYRLSEKKIEAGADLKKIGKIRKIVPLRVLQEVLRIIDEKTEEIEILFNENQVVFKLDEILIISRLIEGNYPEYREIIPAEHKTKVFCDRNELIKNIKAVSLFSKTGINDIFLEFNKDQEVKISAANNQTGESKSSLKIELQGENNSVIFNYKYLLDGLQNIETKRIVFEINSSDAPVLLKQEGKEGYLYLIMPIRK